MNAWNKLKIVLEMIKFEHSIFALPFAYLGAILGSLEVRGEFPSWAEMGWVTLAMVGARSAAMSLNRLIDRHIDAKNPRTKNRAIPAGLVSTTFVWGFVIVSFALLFLSASHTGQTTDPFGFMPAGQMPIKQAAVMIPG